VLPQGAIAVRNIQVRETSYDPVTRDPNTATTIKFDLRTHTACDFRADSLNAGYLKPLTSDTKPITITEAEILGITGFGWQNDNSSQASCGLNEQLQGPGAAILSPAMQRDTAVSDIFISVTASDVNASVSLEISVANGLDDQISVEVEHSYYDYWRRPLQLQHIRARLVDYDTVPLRTIDTILEATVIAVESRSDFAVLRIDGPCGSGADNEAVFRALCNPLNSLRVCKPEEFPVSASSMFSLTRPFNQIDTAIVQGNVRSARMWYGNLSQIDLISCTTPGLEGDSGGIFVTATLPPRVFSLVIASYEDRFTIGISPASFAARVSYCERHLPEHEKKAYGELDSVQGLTSACSRFVPRKFINPEVMWVPLPDLICQFNRLPPASRTPLLAHQFGSLFEQVAPGFSDLSIPYTESVTRGFAISYVETEKKDLRNLMLLTTGDLLVGFMFGNKKVLKGDQLVPVPDPKSGKLIWPVGSAVDEYMPSYASEHLLLNDDHVLLGIVIQRLNRATRTYDAVQVMSYTSYVSTPSSEGKNNLVYFFQTSLNNLSIIKPLGENRKKNSNK
jgi:hypothetical protein